MNVIWRQADLVLELRTAATVQVPANVLEGFLAGNLGPFFNGINRSFKVPGTAEINGYYVRVWAEPTAAAWPAPGRSL